MRSDGQHFPKTMSEIVLTPVVTSDSIRASCGMAVDGHDA